LTGGKKKGMVIKKFEEAPRRIHHGNGGGVSLEEREIGQHGRGVKTGRRDPSQGEQGEDFRRGQLRLRARW